MCPLLLLTPICSVFRVFGIVHGCFLKYRKCFLKNIENISYKNSPCNHIRKAVFSFIPLIFWILTIITLNIFASKILIRPIVREGIDDLWKQTWPVKVTFFLNYAHACSPSFSFSCVPSLSCVYCSVGSQLPWKLLCARIMTPLCVCVCCERVKALTCVWSSAHRVVASIRSTFSFHLYLDWSV